MLAKIDNYRLDNTQIDLPVDKLIKNTKTADKPLT